MRTEQLRYFISLAKTQSLNKTGLEFFTTHQGVSKAIRQLENEIGAPLFTRSSKGMFLTNEGKMFLPVAERCVNDLHDIQLAIRHANLCQNLEGQLSLWGTPITNSIIVPPLIDDFSVLYPKVRYKVEQANSREILKTVSLHSNALGFVIVLHDPDLQKIYAPYIHQVQFYPLQQDEYVCLASSQSPLANYKKISFEEFASYPVATVMSDSSEEHPINQLLKYLGHAELALSTQNLHLCIQAITSGKFHGISSRRSSTEAALIDEKDVVLIPFEEDLTLDIMLATNIRPELDDISQAFVDLVKERSATL